MEGKNYFNSLENSFIFIYLEFMKKLIFSEHQQRKFTIKIVQILFFLINFR